MGALAYKAPEIFDGQFQAASEVAQQIPFGSVQQGNAFCVFQSLMFASHVRCSCPLVAPRRKD